MQDLGNGDLVIQGLLGHGLVLLGFREELNQIALFSFSPQENNKAIPQWLP